MNSELDPTLLAELREVHLSDRASAELERSVLARLLPARGGVRGFVASLGARVRASLGWQSSSRAGSGRAGSSRIVLGAALGMTAIGALYLGSQALSIRASRQLGPEPRRGATGDARQAAPCPLDALPPGFAYEPNQMDPELVRAGLQLDTFAMPIPGCPELVRRTLSYVPHGLLSGPVVIVLHDGGSSAEGVRAQRAQRSFEALEQPIVVYASAAPAAGRPPDSGLWQTEPGAHRAIDDFAYLARIVERLDARGLLYQRKNSGPDVYLVGYGSGAQLALEAAARHPERYAGVAAILPNEVNRTRPPPRRADTRLARLMFVSQPGPPLNEAVFQEWNGALGLPHSGMGQPSKPDLPAEGGELLGPAIDQEALIARRVVPEGTRILDSPFPDRGGPVMRAVVVQDRAALDVGPDGRPAPLDVARVAWEFFERGVPGYPGPDAPPLPGAATP